MDEESIIPAGLAFFNLFSSIDRESILQKIMIYNYNKKLVPYSQSLRKNMTSEEKHLWYDFLKKLPLTVNRQKNIGNYIVDFFIPSKRIVIEIDGSQHDMPENRKSDEQRDEELNCLGILILRYKNSDINNNFKTVCDDLLKRCNLSINDLR